MNMFNTTKRSTEDMNKKLKSLKAKTKLKFFKNISIYYYEMKNKNFQTHQDTFVKNARVISKIYHEVLLLMKFLQTKPQVKNMIIKDYDLYYTVKKTRNENKNIDNHFENNENDFIDINDFINPNHYVGIKKSNEILM